MPINQWELIINETTNPNAQWEKPKTYCQQMIEQIPQINQWRGSVLKYVAQPMKCQYGKTANLSKKGKWPHQQVENEESQLILRRILNNIMDFIGRN